MNACVRIVVLTLASCYSLSASAQEQAGGDDDLDVTMQIIVDPNAKLPDEVVRRIPLPAQRSSASSARSTRSADNKSVDNKPENKPESKADDKPAVAKPEPVERETRDSGANRDSRETGRDAAQGARESAREARDDAKDQREEARDAAKDAKDKAKDKDKDKDKDRPERP